MFRKSFGDFVDKKKREAITQLALIGKLLEQGNFKVETFLGGDDLDDPYIFVNNPDDNSSFDGVRVYKLGSQIAFRIQKEAKTHPYGRAYPLNIEEMFHDLLSEEDAEDEKEAIDKVIEAVNLEIKQFFKKSAKAEKEDRRRTEMGDDSRGDVIVKSSGSDYSNLIWNKS